MINAGLVNISRCSSCHKCNQIRFGTFKSFRLASSWW